MDWTQPASLSARQSDLIFWYVFGLSVLFLVFITALMIYFVIRYRRARHPRAAQIEGHLGLEITWTVVPLLIFLAIFYYGWTHYEFMRTAPADAMVVKVSARQWGWSFEYPNGKQTEFLVAPIHRPVKVEVRTQDVIHGFYIPAFRLKIDAVPGLVNTAWFQAIRLGAYDVECTVICGAGHSQMLSKVVVVPEAAFRTWYFGEQGTPLPTAPQEVAAPPPRAPAGLTLLCTKGCLDCHTLDGTASTGPTLKGLIGRREAVRTQGRLRQVTMDEAQIRAAILHPNASIVQGYPAVMPETPLSPPELTDIIAYLRNLP